MGPYKKLNVWVKAHQLTLDVYRLTAAFARPEFALASQMRRAAQSIPANIAEGTGRVTNAQFAHHLQIAIASARELEYFCLLARDVDAISVHDYVQAETRVHEVTRMLIALRRTVAARARGIKRS